MRLNKGGSNTEKTLVPLLWPAATTLKILQAKASQLLQCCGGTCSIIERQNPAPFVS